MKSTWWIALVIMALILTVSQPSYSNEYIRVGSFNIANFGASQSGEYERSLVSIVNIILEMDADVIALQEIQPTELGRAQVERLVKLLNKAAKYHDSGLYEFIIADEYTGDETTAFVWREPVSLHSEAISQLEHNPDPDNDGVPAFQRVPHYALFDAGDYDFYLVNCHLYTKTQGYTSEGRGAEFKAIVQWIKNLENEEMDAIIVGDFNRFLNGKSAWKQLMIEGHTQWFSFPLLTGIQNAVQNFDPETDEAPDDSLSTTTSKKLSIYDQILISTGSNHEFTSTPEFGVDVGIVAFDRQKQFEWATDSWHDAIKFLSDHRPVWIRLRIDNGDDD